MESKRCLQVDHARATLPPGAPLNPESAAHVRSCARCQEIARLDAAIVQSLRSTRPRLSPATRRRLLRAAAQPTPSWVSGLALAAVLVIALVTGHALRPVVHPPKAEVAAAPETTPLLERLVARHLGRDASEAPPPGVRSETRLPTTLAIGVVEEQPAGVRTASLGGACAVDAEPGASTLFVLDRASVDVDPDLGQRLESRGVVSLVLDGQRVTVATDEAALFVTVTSPERRPGHLARR